MVRSKSDSFTGLTLSGKFYDSEWIRSHFQRLDARQFRPFEIRVLTFCGQWLSGAKKFTIESSGTTAAPKPVSLTRNQMTMSARMTGRELGLQAGDRALVCLSPEYIGGLMMLVRGFVLDLELTGIEPTSNPLVGLETTWGRPVHTFKEFHLCSFVPLQLQGILSSPPQYLDFLNRSGTILLGGAPVSTGLLHKIQKLKAATYQTFGMTETASHIALRRLNGPQAHENYRVLPGIEIKQDSRGCLMIKSELTKNRWLQTNDLVELSSDGTFQWLGRIDHIINTGGVKVPAEVVEKAIAETLYELDDSALQQRDFFVAGLPHEQLGECVVAIFEGKPPDQEQKKRLMMSLRKRLAPYQIPNKILSVESFVRARNGKVDRRATLLRIRKRSFG